jgi:hypothetical protein
MATTTNYGWTTPDDTDLVKDGAAAIRTLGSSADTTVKNLSPGTTAGDLDYYTSGTAKARLGIGTVGQVLTVNSGATAPEWAALPGGGGKVLQVIQATFGTTTSSSSTSYVDTGLTANITPSNASNKVLVMYNLMAYKSSGNIANGPNLRLLRGATDINTQINIFRTDTTVNFQSLQSFAYLDNPATTSATTYKLQFANRNATALVEVFTANTTGTLILMEIGA